MQNKGRLAMIVKEETEAGANGLAHIDNTVSFRKKMRILNYSFRMKKIKV
jgi:hypothetical protein